MVGGTAAGRHVGRVVDCHPEEALQARVAHAMAARKLRRLGRRKLIGAGEAFHLLC